MQVFIYSLNSHNSRNIQKLDAVALAGGRGVPEPYMKYGDKRHA